LSHFCAVPLRAGVGPVSVKGEPLNERLVLKAKRTVANGGNVSGSRQKTLLQLSDGSETL
jgi:hypothetical protein